jgi:hypothetical protein
MNNTHYRVDFKENEFGLWICGDEEDTYESAKNTYDYRKTKFKGVKIVKVTEEVLEEYEINNPFLIGDTVKINKNCLLQGEQGQLISFDLCNSKVVVKIDNDIDFHGNFNDIVKVNK